MNNYLVHNNLESVTNGFCEDLNYEQYQLKSGSGEI